ncbi:MAG: DUF1211 domain-containing protein [Chloroflexi bacterium]|nr:MAG: DUF1211 domain-containing protein [Chloroflexota bacterium]
MRTSRLEAFSDGVFAIAATLLVLELRVPDEGVDLPRALFHLWPAYAAYLISFATIGIIWVNHHTLLEHCKRADRPFLYLNLLLLITVGCSSRSHSAASSSTPRPAGISSVERRRRSDCASMGDFSRSGSSLTRSGSPSRSSSRRRASRCTRSPRRSMRCPCCLCLASDRARVLAEPGLLEQPTVG